MLAKWILRAHSRSVEELLKRNLSPTPRQEAYQSPARPSFGMKRELCNQSFCYIIMHAKPASIHTVYMTHLTATRRANNFRMISGS